MRSVYAIDFAHFIGLLFTLCHNKFAANRLNIFPLEFEIPTNITIFVAILGTTRK